MSKPEQVKLMSLGDRLFEPSNKSVARHLRCGGSVKPITETSLLKWPPEQASRIHTQVVSWLKTGDADHLAKLLGENPTAIVHPAVFRQVLHLSVLYRSTDASDPGGSEWVGTDPVPSGTKRAVGDSLAKLLKAWVEKLVPGYTVERIKYPKRRGAPRKTSEEDAVQLLAEVETLLEKMDKRPVMSFKQREHETREDLIERTARLVQELYSDSWWSLVSYSLPGDPEVDASGKPIFAGRLRRKPLPIDTARSIAQKAVKKRSVSKNNLLYGLLARFYYNQHVTPNQVRGMVERAEADWPEFAPPRRSRKR